MGSWRLGLLQAGLLGCAPAGGSSDCPPLGAAEEGGSEEAGGGGEEGSVDDSGVEPMDEAPVVLRGATLVGAGALDGTVADLRIEDGLIVAMGEVTDDGAVVVDLSGRWLAPAFIDSHVHLAYQSVVEETLDGGVAAAVDLAAPVEFLSEDPGPLRLLRAGPMITAEGGYPTQGWGRSGYGEEWGDTEAAVAAVGQLHELGAEVIKVPMTGSSELSADTVAAVVAEAQGRGLKVAVHALDDDAAARARAAGADVLAHVPTGSLSAETLAAWEGGAVVGTLAAFGGSPSARQNLVELDEAGVTVLYGTDLGNLRETGIASAELELLVSAGFSGARILEMGTSEPARFWGLEGYGELAVGAQGSVLVLEADPREAPLGLAAPEEVWIRGQRR